jgi:hypothetical protein
VTSSASIAAALLVGSFVFSVTRDDAGPNTGQVRLILSGSMVRAVGAQQRGECIAGLVRSVLEREHNKAFVLAGDLQPQLSELLGPVQGSHVVYSIARDGAGHLATKPVPIDIPAQAPIFFLDRAEKTLDSPSLRDPGRPMKWTDTETSCPGD